MGDPFHRNMAEEFFAKFPHRVTFPLRLMWILDSGFYANIMKWSEDGKSFIVLNRDEVGQKALFEVEGRKVQFARFLERLNRYGFGRHPHRDEWKHPDFRRGNSFAIESMKPKLEHEPYMCDPERASLLNWKPPDFRRGNRRAVGSTKTKLEHEPYKHNPESAPLLNWKSPDFRRSNRCELELAFGHDPESAQLLNTTETLSRPRKDLDESEWTRGPLVQDIPDVQSAPLPFEYEPPTLDNDVKSALPPFPRDQYPTCRLSFEYEPPTPYSDVQSARSPFLPNHMPEKMNGLKMDQHISNKEIELELFRSCEMAFEGDRIKKELLDLEDAINPGLRTTSAAGYSSSHIPDICTYFIDGLVKMMDIGNGRIIKWLHDGRSFQVLEKDSINFNLYFPYIAIMDYNLFSTLLHHLGFESNGNIWKHNCVRQDEYQNWWSSQLYYYCNLRTREAMIYAINFVAKNPKKRSRMNWSNELPQNKSVGSSTPRPPCDPYVLPHGSQNQRGSQSSQPERASCASIYPTDVPREENTVGRMPHPIPPQQHAHTSQYSTGMYINGGNMAANDHTIGTYPSYPSAFGEPPPLFDGHKSHGHGFIPAFPTYEEYMNQGPRYGYYLGYEQSLQPPSVLSPEEKVRYESKTMAHAIEGTSKVGTNSTSWTEPVKMSRSECGSQTLNCELSNQMLVEFKQSLCTNFPLMLMWILDCGYYSKHLKWSDDGLSFIVLNTDKCLCDVLPITRCNITHQSLDFYKTLNQWNFQEKNGVWKHPNFRRSRHDMCKSMTSDYNKHFCTIPPIKTDKTSHKPPQSREDSSETDWYLLRDAKDTIDADEWEMLNDDNNFGCAEHLLSLLQDFSLLDHKHQQQTKTTGADESLAVTSLAELLRATSISFTGENGSPSTPTLPSKQCQQLAHILYPNSV